MHGKLVCVVVLLALVCGAACAQNVELGKGLSASFGVFRLQDSDARDVAGTGYGIVLEKQLPSQFKLPLSVSLGYIYASNTFAGADVRLTNVPLFLNTKFNLGQSGKAYYGAGIGFDYAKLNVNVAGLNADDTNFAWQIFAGTKFGTNDKFFADVKYMDGTLDANTGLMFNIGGTF